MSKGVIDSLSQRGFKVFNWGAVFQVHDSSDLSTKKMALMVFEAGFHPVMSANRIDGDHVFTLVPYSRPETFNKVECIRQKMTQQELWSRVEATARREGPVFFPDWDEESGGEGMLECLNASITRADFSIIEFLEEKGHFPGLALDLQCKPAKDFDLLNQGQLRVCTMASFDFQTEYYFGINRFDLVVGSKTLPCVLPHRLKDLVNKIYQALIPGGYFIGTLSTVASNQREGVSEYIEMGCRMFLYPEEVVPALLEDCGFKVKECQKRVESYAVPYAVHFTAQK